MQDLVLKEESYFENLRISVSHIAEKYNLRAFVVVSVSNFLDVLVYCFFLITYLSFEVLKKLHRYFLRPWKITE